MQSDENAARVRFCLLDEPGRGLGCCYEQRGAGVERGCDGSVLSE